MARMEKQSYTFFTGGDKNTGGPASVNGGTEVVATGIAVGCEQSRNSVSQNFAGLKRQDLGLLDLRQRLHLAEHIRRHCAIDLDQCDRAAARFVAAGMEGRDVDPGIPEQPPELAEEAGALLIGYQEHRRA